MTASKSDQQRDQRQQYRADDCANASPADQTLFVLNKEQWQLFRAALNRRSRSKPRLNKLFTEPHIAIRCT